MSKRIILSYLIDWILIIVIAALGGVFNKAVTHTNKRPFSLQDPSITYPSKKDTVSVAVLLLVSLVVPGIITAIISLIFIPGPTASKATPRALIWRRKLWEWNTAWMGLALSVASAFMITEGLKDLAGKPRPYAIGICNPDLANVNRYRLGGLGQSFDTTGATPILVSSDICQERDPATLREIFASWPSGHSSFSWAGLLYLTLFLCAKFAVAIPHFTSHHRSPTVNTYDFDNSMRRPPNTDTVPRTHSPDSSTTAQQDVSRRNLGAAPPRNSSAAPPIYLLILSVFLPLGTAVFICVSRWFDFHHHGIDIFSGALIGAFTAYFSFRYYHMPIRRGSGWSWGARSRGRAFWVGVGRDGYVGDEGWMAATSASTRKETDGIEDGREVEHHKAVLGPGIEDRGDIEALSGGRRVEGQDPDRM